MYKSYVVILQFNFPFMLNNEITGHVIDEILSLKIVSISVSEIWVVTAFALFTGGLNLLVHWHNFHCLSVQSPSLLTKLSP